MAELAAYGQPLQPATPYREVSMVSTNIGRSRVLCIDGDPTTANWMAATLQRAHVDCLIERESRGRDGFRHLMAEGIDICVVEYALPDMTGVQLCGLLRQVGCNVPVIFFSAMNRDIDKQMAFGSGADEYLCKPDDLDIFADAVQHLLKRRRPLYFARSQESSQERNLEKAA